MNIQNSMENQRGIPENLAVKQLLGFLFSLFFFFNSCFPSLFPLPPINAFLGRAWPELIRADWTGSGRTHLKNNNFVLSRPTLLFFRQNLPRDIQRRTDAFYSLTFQSPAHCTRKPSNTHTPPKHYPLDLTHQSHSHRRSPFTLFIIQRSRSFSHSWLARSPRSTPNLPIDMGKATYVLVTSFHCHHRPRDTHSRPINITQNKR